MALLDSTLAQQWPVPGQQPKTSVAQNQATNSALTGTSGIKGAGGWTDANGTYWPYQQFPSTPTIPSQWVTSTLYTLPPEPTPDELRFKAAVHLPELSVKMRFKLCQSIEDQALRERAAKEVPSLTAKMRGILRCKTKGESALAAL